MKDTLGCNTVEARSIKEWLDYNTYLTVVMKTALDDDAFADEDILVMIRQSKYPADSMIIDLKIMGYIDNERYDNLKVLNDALKAEREINGN